MRTEVSLWLLLIAASSNPYTLGYAADDQSVTTIRKYKLGEVERFKVVEFVKGIPIAGTAHLKIKVSRVFPNGDAELTQTNDVVHDGQPGPFTYTENCQTMVNKFGISSDFIPFNELSWAHLSGIIPKAVQFRSGEDLEIQKRAELKGYCYWHTKVHLKSISQGMAYFEAAGEHHDGSGYPPGDSKVKATFTWNIAKHRYDKISLDETYINFRTGKPFTMGLIYTRE